ncbi:MAG: carboxypeptidase regulatory-like domain-containing protein [Acidobacteria bacterium]|nr:carboxypeptidase regulatory-like domain-containing protein [Acidobacteriota bacterium]
MSKRRLFAITAAFFVTAAAFAATAASSGAAGVSIWNIIGSSITSGEFPLDTSDIPQTDAVIFNEDIGSPSGTTAIASYTGWSNPTFTFSGTGDIRNTSPSSGYTGASGSGNAFLTNSGTSTFQIAGIDTSGYTASSLVLKFGQHKSSTTANGTEMTVEVSSDGTTYTLLTFPPRATGAGTANWALITASGSIPSTSNLRIRFTNTSSTTQFRVDDIQLDGDATPTPTPTPPTCPAGSWYNGTSCVAASPGFYVPLPGATSQTPCSAGTYQPNSGSTSCLFAPAGTFVSTTAATSPTLCSAGTYQPSTGQTSCINASPGFVVPAPGATSQVQCPAGTYQPSSGASTCINAPAGFFVSAPASTSPTPCPLGRYQPNSGSTSCIFASAGNFVGSTAQTSQTPCAAGSYQPNTGQSSCILASPGFYVPGTGATAQLECPAGTTSGTGATACTPLIGPPTVTTNAATGVSANAATVNGSANPNGSSTTGWFRYSTADPGTCSDSFGTRAPSSGGTDLGSGTSPTAYNRSIAGLSPATTYYFCAIAQNAEGTSFGSVLNFTTLPLAPAVTTNAATSVTPTSATLNGTANPNGDATTGWFRYSATSPGTCNDSFGARTPATGGTDLGSGTSGVPYSQSVSGLTPGTPYFFCAIAQNSGGTSFGALQTFTAAAAPDVTTNTATSVTASTATLRGSANPNAAATTGWFRYSTTDPGTCNDTFGTRAPSTGGTSLGSGTSAVPYNQAIAGLLPGTTYYFCAIAQNAEGTSFGSVLNFTTLAMAPGVVTSAPNAFISGGVTLNGTASPGGAATTGWFRYSTVSPGTCNDSFGTRAPLTGGTALGSGNSSVPYSQAITGLITGATYYFCAIAENSVGKTFGSLLTFIAQDAPTVTTNAATSVTTSSALLNGTANPNGAATTGWFRYSSTNPGVCSDSFGIRAPASGGSSLGSGTSAAPFGQAISGLLPGTTYYFCAIAQNNIGINFGSVLSFTTNSAAPVVTTNAATGITDSGATLNGSANPNGETTTGWFRYSTVSPGTCNDSFGTRAPTSGGTNLGSGTSAVPYSQAIIGLLPGTTYYYCAIAQNVNGTAFGAVQSFITAAAPPTVTTNAASSVTANTALLNGSANPNGAATTGWFRYSTTDPGTCNDLFGTRAPSSGGTSLGSGTSAVPYSQAIAGLTPATTYYFCAIASNAEGTNVGSVLSFTTNALPPTVTTNPASLVTNSSAQLNGSANPGGAETTGWFRYATASPGTCNDSFGTRAPITGGTSLGSGTSAVGYSQGITGLSASTTYYFCAIAQNSLGTSFGAVQSFVTDPDPTPTPTPTPTPEVQFSSASYMDDESQSAVITVTRTGSLSGTSSVDVVLTDGTATGGASCATPGVDYVYTGPVTLNFAINDDSESFSVPLCGDLVNEGTETVNLSLTNNVNADIGSPNTAVLSINDTASQFRNATAIDMFLGTAGSPNPSTINVTGGPTVIGSMRVTLYDLSHDFPDNIDILLVGPNGAEYVLMGDTGGPFTIDVNSPVTLSFTDSAAAVLPDSNVLTTGTYLPTTCETPVTNFAPPAPAGPYIEPGCVVSRPITQSMFGAFGLTSPMGNWNLYVRDDNGSPLTMTAIGTIAGGWGIEFLPPTAAGVEVSGRVLTPDGRGLRNAVVTMTDANGITRTTVTSSFGYYRFEGVPVGDSFVMTVNSRSYRFVPRLVNVLDNMTDVDFVGLE